MENDSGRTAKVFGWSLSSTWIIYTLAEAIFQSLLRVFPTMNIPGIGAPTPTHIATMATMGSAAAGLSFVLSRRQLTFPLVADGVKSTYARFPKQFAAGSGILVGVIVFTTSYLFTINILSTLEVALFLRSSVIIISWGIDQLHVKKLHLKQRPSGLENLAVLAALGAIFFASVSYPSVRGHHGIVLAVLLPLYYAAYGLRLHLMNRFKQEGLLAQPQMREAYFSWEQIGFCLSAAVVFVLAHAIPSFGIGTGQIMPLIASGAGWGMFVAGSCYAVAGIMAVAILLNPRLSATRAGLLSRLGALAASILAGLALYVVLDIGGPKPSDLPTVALFVAASVLLAAAQQQREATLRSSRHRNDLRLGRLVVLLLGGYLVCERLATNLHLIVKSPFAGEINLFAVVGETAMQSAVDLLPFVIAGGALTVLFFSRRVKEEWTAGFGGIETLGGGPVAQEGIKAEAPRAQLAIQRLGWGVAVFGALLTVVMWTYDAPAKRLEILKYLDSSFTDPDCRRGRVLLGDAAYCGDDGATCRFCADSRLMFSYRDANVDSVRWHSVSSTMNAAESVLFLRKTGALREIDFHALWAGVTDGVCDQLAKHVRHSPDLWDSFKKHSPLLFDRALAIVSLRDRAQLE
jgi:hypothetical protein